MTRIPDYYTEAGKRVMEETVLPIVISTGRWEGEIQFRNFRTGPPIETDSSVFMVRHPQSGEPLCLATVTRDITERKRQEEELRSKTAFLVAQTESSLDGLLVVDDQQRKVLQNQQFADIWQIPPETRTHPTDEATLQLGVSRTKDPEKFLERVMYLYAHPDDTAREEIELEDGRVLDRHSAPVKGSDGHYYGRIWAFRDITESEAP